MVKLHKKLHVVEMCCMKINYFLDDLYHFIFDICNSYHPANPYHNFRHAVDVLQANYYFLCKLGMMEPMTGEMELIATSQVKELLQPLDIFALLMASIGHDVSHPGVNNHFMVNRKRCRTITWNDLLNTFYPRSPPQHLWLFYTTTNLYWKVFMPWHFFTFYKQTVFNH